MKRLYIILFAIILSSILGFSKTNQKKKSQCDCKKEPIWNNNYSCDTIFFTNHSIMYWQWNCDSSWLSLENKNGEVFRLKTCYGDGILDCDRFGLGFIEEYPDYLLFQYRWVSGCCDPPDLIFIDKNKGQEIKKIEKFMFINGETDNHYLLYFNDTTFKSLELLFHKSGKKYSYTFPDNRVQKTFNSGKFLFPKDMFKNFVFEDSLFSFDYQYIHEGVLITEKVKITTR